MNRFYSVFFLFFLITFSGCTPTTSMEYFTKNETEAYSVQYTKKRDIVFDNEVKIMVIATYLNKISPKYKNDEHNIFVVGIHYSELKEELTEDRFVLNLNGESPSSLVKLKKDSKLLENISLKNEWASYYLVEFKNEDSKKLNLKFMDPSWGTTTIAFQK